MGLSKLIVLAAVAAGVANAKIPQIGCDGDCDRTGYGGLGGGRGYGLGSDCDTMAAALNKLDGVSGVDCGGNYPFLFFEEEADGEKAVDKCNTVAAVLNKLAGVSSISCSDDEYNFLVVATGNCPAVPAKLTAILQGPTCKHGNPIPGPSGGGNCTGACEQGWQGSNCDVPSANCTAATEQDCKAETCPALSPDQCKCVEGAANGACQRSSCLDLSKVGPWPKNSSCSSCLDLSKCGPCTDTANGKTDGDSKGCGTYKSGPDGGCVDPYWDDLDFSADLMCCVCGGGKHAPRFELV